MPDSKHAVHTFPHASAFLRASTPPRLPPEMRRQEYKQAPTWASWLAGGGNEHGGARAKLRRVRASYLLGSALRQLATVHTELPAKSGGGGDTAAEPHLRAALVALQVWM
eukprot:352968-Chlamydomonas_euryale.AAC.3